MQFRAPDTATDFALIAGWLAKKSNGQWLEITPRRCVSAEWLRITAQRGASVYRLFTPDSEERPVGIVALGDVNREYRTANLWVVLGDSTFARQGYATRAAARMLTIGFAALALEAIHTWIVDENPSVRIADRLGFNLIGRQRRCHYIDGRPHDRLWFDLLASEHAAQAEELHHVGSRTPS